MLYRLSDFTQNISKDITGGLTAGVVALPLALAFGIASGAGAMAGIYGAIILGILAAIFGGTRQQISGPTGPMTVVMTTVIMDFTVQFPEQWLSLAFTTVILAGLMQILFGMLRIGKYIVMVPYPVISGFMSGIGLIIIVLQIPVLLGFAVPSSLPEVFSNLHDYVQQVYPTDLMAGHCGDLDSNLMARYLCGYSTSVSRFSGRHIDFDIHRGKRCVIAHWYPEWLAPNSHANL